MNKSEITSTLKSNYSEFIDFINNLSKEDFEFSPSGKWSAGQQLSHLVICSKPLVQVYSMDASTLQQTFGSIERPKHTYEDLIELYKTKINEGGKAPEKYAPQITGFDQKVMLCSTLEKLIKDLNTAIDRFSEEELDTLVIPHPLLGKLTLREMSYNAIQHVKVHLQSSKNNLLHPAT